MEKGSQKCSQSDLFDSEKGYNNDKIVSGQVSEGEQSSKKQHNNSYKAGHYKKEDKAFLGLTNWVADDRMKKG